MRRRIKLNKIMEEAVAKCVSAVASGDSIEAGYQAQLAAHFAQAILNEFGIPANL